MSYSQELSLILKALSHPIRLAMLRELMRCKNCINSELVSKFPLSQSTVSQHLEVLARAKLIRIKRVGKTSQYCINQQSFNKQLTKVMDFARELALNIPEISAC